MIKLKTGVSTSLDFVKALKERGQDASPAFPAETLREQLDALSDDVKITFKSNNETVLQVVNDNEPGPTPVEKVILTLDFNGGKTSDTTIGVGSIEVELDKGSTYTPTNPTTDPEFVVPEGYIYDGWTLVKDNASTRIQGSITVEQDMTIYTLWYQPVPPTPGRKDWDGVDPAAVHYIYFKDTMVMDPESSDYTAFKADLENYEPYDQVIFSIDSIGDLNGYATMTSEAISLAFTSRGDRQTPIARWLETAPGVFTKQAGSQEEEHSPEEGGIVFVGTDGSVANAAHIFLSLVEIEE